MQSLVCEKGDDYPAFRFQIDGHAPRALVADVAWIIQNLNLTDSEVFSEAHQLFFRLIKRNGVQQVMEWLRDVPETHYETVLRKDDLIHRVGAVVFDRLGEKQRNRYFPWNDVAVFPVGHEFCVRIQSLYEQTVNGQTFYYSSRKPTVELGGCNRIVAFTQHAIDRTCERIVPAWKTYWGLGDLFPFFNDCVYFEPAIIYPSDPGFTFFNSCSLDHFHAEVVRVACEYANQVIGFDALFTAKQLGKKWYYRVGYSPAALIGDFAVAITLKYPGFTGTPEYGLIRKSRMDRHLKAEMLNTARKQSIEQLQRTFDFSLIKWFHDNGIPQVVSLERTVFDRSGTAPASS